jgi:hypothetical protein
MSGIATDPSTEAQTAATELTPAQRVLELEARLAEMQGLLEAAELIRKQDDENHTAAMADLMAHNAELEVAKQRGETRIQRLLAQRDEANERLEKANNRSFAIEEAGNALAMVLFGAEDSPTYGETLTSIMEYWSKFRGGATVDASMLQRLAEMAKMGHVMSIDYTTKMAVDQIAMNEEARRQRALFELELEQAMQGEPDKSDGSFLNMLGLGGIIGILRRRASGQ